MLENSGFFVSFIFGTIVGSFLNVVILRIPVSGESIVFPPSHCPQCKTQLKWYENVPIISFLLLKGRCRTCGKPISWQYPLVELSMGLLSMALLVKFSLAPQFGIFFLYCAALLVIIFIDLYHQVIPDVISIPGIFLGFAFSFLNSSLSWSDSGIGILLGGGIFYLIAGGYYLVTRRVGMGGGDIKLLAMIGAWLGWQSLPFVIFASSFSGSLVGLIAMLYQKKGGRTRIPFGPFLSIAALFYLFFKEQILYFFNLYLSGQWP